MPSEIVGISTLASVFTSLAAVVGTILVAGVIWRSNGRIRKIQRKQYKSYLAEQKRQTVIADRQRRLDSANLIIELDKVRRSDGFRKLQLWLVTDTIDLRKSEHMLWFIRYVNHAHIACMFFVDDLISEPHMATAYGGLEKLLTTNRDTREFLEKHEARYPYLTWYFRYVRLKHS